MSLAWAGQGWVGLEIVWHSQPLNAKQKSSGSAYYTHLVVQEFEHPIIIIRKFRFDLNLPNLHAKRTFLA